MKNFERSNPCLSLCGLNCLLCPMQLSGHCGGCGFGSQSCPIARCSLEQGKIEYCYECEKYPCDRYLHIDEYDSFITHRRQPPDCLSPDIFYDMIYLSAVDYGIPQPQLVYTLDHLRYQLLPNGELVCLSASLLQEETLAARFVNFSKNCIRGILHYLGIRNQQFWGWRRTQTEYRNLFASTGYKDIEDGWLDDGFGTYWIRGAAEKVRQADTAQSEACAEAASPAGALTKAAR